MTRTPTPALALVLTLALAASARSQGPGPETPSLFPRGYLGHAELTAALRRVAAAHPDRVRLESLAKSAGGRDVWLVTVDGPKKSPGSARAPAVLVVANLEADHVVGSQVALGIVERLAAGDPPPSPVYIVPRLNPDGADRVVNAGPLADFRTNLRPIDRDRDGRRGEDGPDDLDGDGLVTLMRVSDPLTATLIADPKDPRISRKADPAKGERAAFAEEPEGRDDDGDGLRNEDPPGGVNLNRNWPHHWPEFDPEAGFSPASEPEVLGLIRFAFDHPEIAAVWSFALNDNLREAPKKPGSTLDDADLPLFAELSRAFVKLTTPPATPKGVSPAGKGTPAPGATPEGSIGEWAYHQFGVVGLSSRLWPTPEIPAPPETKDRSAPKSDHEQGGEKPGATSKPKTKATAKASDDVKPKPAADPNAIPDDGEARWLDWNDRVMHGRAFVPFRTAPHPTLGKVEIGGWRPGVRLNPPAELLPALTDAHLAFLRDLTGKLPRLTVPAPKVVARGGGLFELTAVVANDGGLPTALAQGVRTKNAPPVLVRLEAGKTRLLAGRALERIDALAGSGGRREFRWLLLAPEGEAAPSVKLNVSCPKAGTVVVDVPLK